MPKRHQRVSRVTFDKKNHDLGSDSASSDSSDTTVNTVVTDDDTPITPISMPGGVAGDLAGDLAIDVAPPTGGQARGPRAKQLKHLLLDLARQIDDEQRIDEHVLEAVLRMQHELSTAERKVFATRASMSLSGQELPCALAAFKPWSLGSDYTEWRLPARVVLGMIRPSLDACKLPIWIGILDVDGSLALDGHRLLVLPDSISQLNVTGHIDLSNNSLACLPLAFGGITVGGDLLLHHNNLTELPPSFADASCGGALDVSHNQLTELPGGFGRSRFHGDLRLGHNQLTSLPASLGRVTVTGNFELQRNQLRKLPKSVKHLCVHGDLRLDRNNLKALPPGAEDMVVCGEIWLGYNSLEADVPRELRARTLMHSTRIARCCMCLHRACRDFLVAANVLSVSLFVASTVEVGSSTGWRLAAAQSRISADTYVVFCVAMLGGLNVVFRGIERFFRSTYRPWRRHVAMPITWAHLYMVVEFAFELDFVDPIDWFIYYMLTMLNFLIHGFVLMHVGALMFGEPTRLEDAVLDE